tara:strand:+ start:21090 stop:21644 length:555 start_codon:yes stop_codon:yes gene_type:complete
MKHVLRWMTSALLGLAVMACAAPDFSSASAGPVTVYVVRHAEKASADMAGDKGPDLTAQGKARAERLADLLKDEAVSSVWSTDTARTRQTASPTADQHGLEIAIYDPGAPDALAEAVKVERGVVLVVGHSNTIAGIASALTGRDEGGDLSEADYETLYRVEVNSRGEGVAYALSYDSLEQSLAD